MTKQPHASHPAGKPPAARVITVLLVDDNDDTRILTKWFLDNFGFVVDSARSAQEALARFDPKTHDVILTDNSMPGMTGQELAHVAKLRSPSTGVVMFTGNPPIDQSCIDRVIAKPASLLDVKEAIDSLMGEKPAKQ
jgi:CheY-like chemotaxis protein